jgi:hypothetical protein
MASPHNPIADIINTSCDRSEWPQKPKPSGVRMIKESGGELISIPIVIFLTVIFYLLYRGLT